MPHAHYQHPTLGASWCMRCQCSFVKEFAALRKKVERDPSNTGLMMFANLIHALRDCVSLLRERKHDAILTEVLGIKLWGAPPVRIGYCFVSAAACPALRVRALLIWCHACKHAHTLTSAW